MYDKMQLSSVSWLTLIYRSGTVQSVGNPAARPVAQEPSRCDSRRGDTRRSRRIGLQMLKHQGETPSPSTQRAASITRGVKASGLATTTVGHFARCQAPAALFNRTPASVKTDANSPDWNISRTISHPPTNSPLTYSWGTVGQLAYSFTP